MEEVITKKMFDDFMQVAELGLTPEEQVQIRAEMNNQMKVIRELETIPLEDGLQPVIHGNPYPAEIRGGLREDVCVPFDNVAGILEQAPLTKDGYLVSPDVAHQKLG